MSLRWKGKPDPGKNLQADAIMPLCFCRFVGLGEPLDGKKCQVHGSRSYPCDRCFCRTYIPSKPKTHPSHHPLCVCGHYAQEHN